MTTAIGGENEESEPSIFVFPKLPAREQASERKDKKMGENGLAGRAWEAKEPPSALLLLQHMLAAMLNPCGPDVLYLNHMRFDGEKADSSFGDIWELLFDQFFFKAFPQIIQPFKFKWRKRMARVRLHEEHEYDCSQGELRHRYRLEDAPSTAETFINWFQKKADQGYVINIKHPDEDEKTEGEELTSLEMQLPRIPLKGASKAINQLPYDIANLHRRRTLGLESLQALFDDELIGFRIVKLTEEKDFIKSVHKSTTQDRSGFSEEPETSLLNLKMADVKFGTPNILSRWNAIVEWKELVPIKQLNTNGKHAETQMTPKESRSVPTTPRRKQSLGKFTFGQLRSRTLMQSTPVTPKNSSQNRSKSPKKDLSRTRLPSPISKEFKESIKKEENECPAPKILHLRLRRNGVMPDGSKCVDHSLLEFGGELKVRYPQYDESLSGNSYASWHYDLAAVVVVKGGHGDNPNYCTYVRMPTTSGWTIPILGKGQDGKELTNASGPAWFCFEDQWVRKVSFAKEVLEFNFGGKVTELDALIEGQLRPSFKNSPIRGEGRNHPAEDKNTIDPSKKVQKLSNLIAENKSPGLLTAKAKKLVSVKDDASLRKNDGKALLPETIADKKAATVDNVDNKKVVIGKITSAKSHKKRAVEMRKHSACSLFYVRRDVLKNTAPITWPAINSSILKSLGYDSGKNMNICVFHLNPNQSDFGENDEESINLSKLNHRIRGDLPMLQLYNLLTLALEDEQYEYFIVDRDHNKCMPESDVSSGSESKPHWAIQSGKLVTTTENKHHRLGPYYWQDPVLLRANIRVDSMAQLTAMQVFGPGKEGHVACIKMSQGAQDKSTAWLLDTVLVQVIYLLARKSRGYKSNAIRPEKVASAVIFLGVNRDVLMDDLIKQAIQALNVPSKTAKKLQPKVFTKNLSNGRWVHLEGSLCGQSVQISESPTLYMINEGFVMEDFFPFNDKLSMKPSLSAKSLSSVSLSDIGGGMHPLTISTSRSISPVNGNSPIIVPVQLTPSMSLPELTPLERGSFEYRNSPPETPSILESRPAPPKHTTPNVLF